MRAVAFFTFSTLRLSPFERHGAGLLALALATAVELGSSDAEAQLRFPSPTPRPAASQPPAAAAATPPSPVVSPTPAGPMAAPQAGAAPAAAPPTPTAPVAAPPAVVAPAASTEAASTAPPSPWPPPLLPYREGMPIAPGYHVESESRSGLALGGLVVFGIPYISGLVAAASSGFTKSSGWLALPIAGPFVAMGGRSIDCSIAGEANVDLNEEEDQCRKSALAEARVVALLTVSGIVQTAGAILTVAGLATRDTYLVRDDLSSEPTSPPAVTLDGDYGNGELRLTARLRF